MRKKILIIDDDETSNFVTSTVIQRMEPGIEIQTALNGVEAMEFFKKNPDNIPPVTLLDINMPLMNGFEFLDWYNQSEFRGKTKIVMYTSSVREDDRKQAVRYNDVIAYIEKPLSEKSFSEILY